MSKWLYRAKAVFPLVAMLTASVSAFAGIAMPRIMSHRGESLDRPENTMAAFRLAFERGVDGVECDVYCTSDGVPVIIHDSTTKRTAGSGTNLTVTASTWNQLKDVRVGAFGSWIGTEWEGETLPKFEDYLALLSMNSTTRCIVELKGNGANNLIQNVVAAVQAQPLATSNRVVFIAFDTSLISAIRTALPNYPAWLLLNSGTYTGANLISRIKACNATGVDIDYQSTFSAADVAAVKAAGYSFAVWTCDSDAAAYTLARKGVDEIATNRGGAMKTSLAAMLEAPADTSAYLESFYFRYDFTDGTRQFIGNASQASDPITAEANATNFVAAYGQDGANTAVRVTSNAYGSNTIGGSESAGKTVLAGDWTLAMSLRPGSVNKGLLFSLGRANVNGSKVIFLASSSSPGKLYVGTARRKVKSGTYSDSNTRELAHEWELTTSADLTTGYHTIVASHVAGGTVTVYVDGELAGTVDTTLDCSAATCVFGNGIQFNQAHGTATFLSANGYSQSLDNPDVAFQDVRFYSSAFTAEDAVAYAALYPATLPGFSNLDQHAYVEAHGTNTVRTTGNAIDTGYKATKTTTFKVDYQATCTDATMIQGRIFGARGDFGANHYVNGSGQFAFNMGSAQDGHWKSLSVKADTNRHWFTLAPASKGFTGTLYGADRKTVVKTLNDSTATSDKTATLNVHLFADKFDANTLSGYGYVKIYSFMAETNGVTAAFFAPTTDGNGAAGFTNVVAGTFHGEVNASATEPLLFVDGVGRAEDYRYRSGKFYSRIYASSADATKGLVKFDGGEAAGTNAQFTARGKTAKIVAVPADGYVFGGWTGDTWAIVYGSVATTEITVESDTAIQLRATFRRDANALLTVPADGSDSIDWNSADWRDIDNVEIDAPKDKNVTIVAHKSFTLNIDEDLSLGNLTIQADTNCVVTLVKGSGSLVTVETIVKSGVLSQGSEKVLGATPKVTVEDGGTFDFNKLNVNTATAFHIAGAGAGDWPWALTSTGGAPSDYVHKFVLTTNATIGSSADSQLKVGYAKESSSRGSMTLNGHTLAVTGGMWLTFRKIKTPGMGTILYNGRGTAFYESAINTEEGTTTFILGDGITQNLTVNNAATVNALEWRGCTLDTSSAALTIKSSLTGYGTTAKLTFADGATAVLEGDLTVTNALTASGALSLTRAAGVETNVTVAATGTLTASGIITVGEGVIFDIGTNRPAGTLTVDDDATLVLRKASASEEVIEVHVMTQPQNIVVYDIDGTEIKNLSINYDFGTLMISAATPHWTNNDGTGSLDSQGNWNYMPADGNDVVFDLTGDVAVTASVERTFGRMAINGAHSVDFTGAKLQFTAIDVPEGCTATLATLDGIAEGGVTGTGALALAPGDAESVTIGGLSAFTGDFSVTPEHSMTGTLTCAATTLDKFTLNGTTNVVFTLVNGTDGSFKANEIVVAGGVLQQGTDSVLSTTPKLTVLDGGTLDINKLKIEDVTKSYIAGSGAGDWPWAICSSAGSMVSKNYLADITLLADATIGGPGQLKIGALEQQANKIVLNNHKLMLARGISGNGGVATFRNINTDAGTLELAPGYIVTLNNSNNLNSDPNHYYSGTTLIIRDGARVANQSDRGIYATNVQLDGGNIWAGNNDSDYQGFGPLSALSGHGTIAKLDMPSGAVYKPDGLDYLNVTNSLSGTVKVDISDPALVGKTRIPLLRVPTALMETADSALDLSAVSRTWELSVNETGDGNVCYELVMSFDPNDVPTLEASGDVVWSMGEWTAGGATVLAPSNGTAVVNVTGTATLTLDGTVSLDTLVVNGGSDAKLTLVTAAGATFHIGGIVLNGSVTLAEGSTFSCVGMEFGVGARLTADCDLRTFASASLLGTLDLSGNKLTVSGFPGAATITSSAPGGVLEVDVPEGEAVTNETMAISGGSNLQVWKTGAGTLTMAKVNSGFGGNNVTSLVIKAGVVRQGTLNNAACGADGSRVVVEDGAQFDVNGNGEGYVISGSGPNGLSVTPASMLFEGDGRIDVYSALSFYQHSASASNCTVTVYGNLNQNAGGFTAVKSLIFEDGSSFVSMGSANSQTNVVFDTYVPNIKYSTDAGTSTVPIVKLGDAAHLTPTLDLSRFCTNGVDVVFDAGNTTFKSGATVSVKLGDRTIGDQDGKKVVSWTTRPQGVKFVCGDEGQNCTFAAESDGLYVYRGFSVFLY